jgi:predicted DNA binding CopG/RHH family protein
MLKRNRSKIVRDHWIKVRVTEDELKAIQELAIKNGLAVGNLIRLRLLGVDSDQEDQIEENEK